MGAKPFPVDRGPTRVIGPGRGNAGSPGASTWGERPGLTAAPSDTFVSGRGGRAVGSALYRWARGRSGRWAGGKCRAPPAGSFVSGRGGQGCRFCSLSVGPGRRSGRWAAGRWRAPAVREFCERERGSGLPVPLSIGIRAGVRCARMSQAGAAGAMSEEGRRSPCTWCRIGGLPAPFFSRRRATDGGHPACRRVGLPPLRREGPTVHRSGSPSSPQWSSLGQAEPARFSGLHGKAGAAARDSGSAPLGPPWARAAQEPTPLRRSHPPPPAATRRRPPAARPPAAGRPPDARPARLRHVRTSLDAPPAGTRRGRRPPSGAAGGRGQGGADHTPPLTCGDGCRTLLQEARRFRLLLPGRTRTLACCRARPPCASRRFDRVTRPDGFRNPLA